LGKNILGSGFALEVVVHRGAGAYICGEETSLIESIEGKRGFPRLKPPYPAVEGLFGKPTIVNNVETLACLPHIINRGAKWFASIGRPQNTGPKLFCVSGHVNRPGVVELPLGVTFREIIFDHCGGIRDGHTLKGFFPGGSSAPILTAEQADVRADFDACAEAGSMLGSGGVIVLDDSVDMVEAAANLAHFYAHESCGQCTPCREGADWAVDILERILHGHGRPEDLDVLLRICTYASNGMTICPLGDAFALPISSMIKKFREDFEQRIASATPLPQKKSPVLPWTGARPGFGR
jgi:NADH-quinone oxidoreductase subunit F